ncbi:MAG: hypothetical protein PUP92_10790 [Rhizonema sp. PD38]|nr:hypothetical protein [Rhizonema sp. PD38]
MALQFENVVWRSLQNVAPLEEFVDDILQFLLHLQRYDSVLPTNIDGKLSRLIDCLQTTRCLLILPL